MEILHLKNLVKSYPDGNQEREIIADLNLKLKQGEVVAVVGPSGSGKSTFLSMAGLLITPNAGEIQIKGTNTSSLNDEEKTLFRKEHIGYIFQGSHLIPYLKVKEQLQIIQSLSDYQNNKEVDKLLLDLGISHRAEAYPEALSGGEKQRVAIARAFINHPSLILADEPTANLDESLGREIIDMIRRQVKARDTAAIVVTHDTSLLSLMDRVYRLNQGQLEEMQV